MMMPMPEPDMTADPAGTGLLQAARGGSTDALGRLLELYRPFLTAIADRSLDPDLRPRGGPSDLVQETFAEAARQFPAFAGGSIAELVGWLRAILAHNCTDFALHHRRRQVRSVAREVRLDGGTVASGLVNPDTPSQVAMRDERSVAMEAAYARLPDDYREVIRLRHREGRPFPEVAAAMGRTEPATRKLWGRAVRQWREEVEAGYGPL
jgi:RNA polymerase sigma-70 factor (ECF subfamily)